MCGRDNPHGLRLDLFLDPQTSAVRVTFTPRPQDIGFEGVVHGGALATVLDEAMVWAATWAGKRFCVAGELSVRFRRSAGVGEPLRVETRVESARPRLIQTSGIVSDSSGVVLAEATGKYVPVPPERNRHVLTTLVDEASTARAASVLKAAV